MQSFYKSASKEAPEWVNDDIIEQNTLEESKEDATVELRAFLVNEINEYYNKYVKTIETYGNGEATRQDIGNTKLMDRIVFCIDYKIIPYIYEYKSKQGIYAICITSILKEIVKKKIGNGNLNTLKDVANEIPSFDYNTRTIGGKSVKAAYGPRRDFIDFLTAEAEDI